MVDGNADRSGDGQSPEAGEQTRDQQPAADHFGECSHVRQQDREGEMQGTHEGVGEVLDVGELLVTVVNEK